LCEETGRFDYSNAGHNQPVVIKNKKLGLVLLEKVVCRWGGFRTDNVNRSIEVEQGDTLFLYTDGVTEAQSPDGKFYGMNRLEHS
jgi:sigma-B regulation protein RsbU (phosphoserine phosphatase)